jgi:RNA polymerase sigma-70 factor (ECF subfamily)
VTVPKHESEFVALLEEHQNIVHRICRIYTQSEAEHKDLFQEISIQLWRSFDRFEGKSKFSTWMYRVGLNTAITLYRKNKKRIDTYEINEEINGIELDDYDPVIDEQLNWLYEEIEKFSEIDKALVLLYLENKRYNEIAETLGISTVNARVKMNRIKQRLKKMIKQE